jgi:hypothetical protein
MKTTVILIIVLVLMSVSGGFLFHQWRIERAGRIRNENNIVVLTRENKAFKGDTTKARTGIINMTTEELRRTFPDLVNLIKKELGVNSNNVAQVVNTETVVNQTFKTHIKDSINYRIDTIPLQYMVYKDIYLDFEAQKINDDVYVTRNINRVPLLQVISKEPWKLKHILPWKWGTRQLIQDVSTENPHAKIEFSRTINITKK